MRSVGLKVLKNKLSDYVRIAAGGETVLVLDRDRVVAELNPPRPEHALQVGDANLFALVRRALLRPAIATDEPIPRKPIPGGSKMLQDLTRERDER